MASPRTAAAATTTIFPGAGRTLAAAALMHKRTGARTYDDWYRRLGTCAWHHFVEHRHGAWYRILGRDNRKLDDKKSPAGKTDHHTMGACHQLLALVRGHRAS